MLGMLREPSHSANIGSMPGIHTGQTMTVIRLRDAHKRRSPSLDTNANAVLRIRPSRRRCCALPSMRKTRYVPSPHLKWTVCLLLGVSDVRKQQCGAALPVRGKLLQSGTILMWLPPSYRTGKSVARMLSRRQPRPTTPQLPTRAT